MEHYERLLVQAMARKQFIIAGNGYIVLKYQEIMCSDGIIFHLHGPVDGLNHDAAVLDECCISNLFDMHVFAPNGTRLQLYDDPAYGISDHLISAFRGAVVGEQQQLLTRTMSRVRIVVDWCFNEVLQKFMFFD